MTALRAHWRRFWFAPQLATNLAVSRLVFFGAVLLYYWHVDFSEWADVSPVLSDPIALFRFLSLPVFSHSVLTVTQAVWKVSLATSCVGLATRASTAVACVLGTYLMGVPQNFGTHHHDALLAIICGILALSRCGDAWSLDRWLWSSRLPAGLLPANGEYRWPIRLVWVAMVCVFFAAGISKLRWGGLRWVMSDTLAITLIQAGYHVADRDPLARWGLQLAHHVWMCRVVAAGVLLSELSVPLALFNGYARRVLVPTLFCIQIGIRLVMGASFTQFLAAYVFWIPWEEMVRRISAAFPASAAAPAQDAPAR